jgi:hypothetical protein
MAYNNGFPIGYPQFPYQPQMQMQQPVSQMQQPQAQTSNLTWVQGEAGAKSYLVAPNTTVQLWDSEAQTIYLKSADGSGMPTMKILDYTIREQAQQGQNVPTLMHDDVPEYVTKSELTAFEEKIQKQLDKITIKRREKREVEDDE